MEITKNNLSFNVKGAYSEKWFSSPHFQHWEKSTFHIMDHYYDMNGTYIDVGAWIGPTVMYAAQIFKNVVAIEADRLAFHRLTENLSVNNFNNITLINKCLSDKDEIISFGGNGKWGNSESTMLVSNPEYSSWEGRWTKEEREQHIESVETISIDTLFTNNNINPEDVCFIKMDIEGGEMIVIPGISHILRKYKPVLYLSIHYCFLQRHHIQDILDTLFDIYDNCYTFSDEGLKSKINKETIIENTVTAIVFE